MLLLSRKAGLRAKAIAALPWAMVPDARGQVADALQLPNRASKGRTGGRTMPLHPNVQQALAALQTVRDDRIHGEIAYPKSTQMQICDMTLKNLTDSLIYIINSST